MAQAHGENLKQAMDTLKAHKLRSFLTVFGVVLGVSVIQLAVFAKVVLVGKGIGESPLGHWVLRSFPLEAFLLSGLALASVGIAVDAGLLYRWIHSGFGPIAPRLTSLAMLASTAITIGGQSLFSSFFAGILRGALTDVWVD